MLIAQVDPVAAATIEAAIFTAVGGLVGVGISELIRYFGRVRAKDRQEVAADTTAAEQMKGLQSEMKELREAVEKIESDISEREQRLFARLETVLKPFTDPEAVSKRAEQAAENRRDIMDNAKDIAQLQGRFDSMKSQMDTLQGSKEVRLERVAAMSDRQHRMEQEYSERFGKIDARFDSLNRAMPTETQAPLKTERQ